MQTGRGIAKNKINFDRICINLLKKWHIPLGYYGTDLIPMERCGKYCSTKSYSHMIPLVALQCFPCAILNRFGLDHFGGSYLYLLFTAIVHIL